MKRLSPEARTLTGVIGRSAAVVFVVALLLAYSLLRQRLGQGSTPASVAFHLVYVVSLVAAGTLTSTFAETKTVTATVNPGGSPIVLLQMPTVQFIGDNLDADDMRLPYGKGSVAQVRYQDWDDSGGRKTSCTYFHSFRIPMRPSGWRPSPLWGILEIHSQWLSSKKC